MNKINKFLSITSAIICSGITTITTQLPTKAESESPLCKNLNMGTQILISTKEFNAAICDKYYIEPQSGCPVSLEYFYVGQSRKTGESVVLSTNDASTKDPFMRLYKARNGNYTYQIASSGGYVGSPWTSLSVFNNGKRVYHRKVNSYYGYYDC